MTKNIVISNEERNLTSESDLSHSIRRDDKKTLSFRTKREILRVSQISPDFIRRDDKKHCHFERREKSYE